VTGPGGTDTETKTGYITVSEVPPAADFSGTPTTGYRPLTVQFTDGSSGSITSRSWTFGDGGTSTAQNPSHQYSSTGTYTVTLTVTGPGGTDTETKTGYIVVTEAPPIANFSGTPTTGYRPLTVQFTDGSSGSITSRSWTFGDGGTSTAQNPSHQYSSTGTYTVTLTVTGPGGTDTETKTGYIVVTEAPPVANFSGAPTSGYMPLTVNFLDVSAGNITNWSWNFGDGGTSTAQNPSHTYNATGTYTVSLTVTGPGGTDTETKTGYIHVSSAPPLAKFNADKTSGFNPLTVHFTDESTGNITGWSWNFGDGGSSSSQNPSHIYSSTGCFDVSLAVTGPEGTDSLTKSNYICVSEALPVANFSANITLGNKPLMVLFSDHSTGNITSWLWDFGDGGTSTDQDPSHTYVSTGNFTVTLTVTGPGGTNAEIKTSYITVNECSVKVPKDYPTIQRAIDAVDNGCTVLVSSGIYTENINFHGKAIRVKGVGTSNSCGCLVEGMSKVTIHGTYDGSVVTFNTGEDRSSILENFTINHGKATRGGGIFIENASPTIIDCYINENLAYEKEIGTEGGGIYVTGNNASPLIFNNLIVGNWARSDAGLSYGGGIYVTGGANPTIQNCTVSNNESYVPGGGIHITTGASAHIVDSIIWGNTQNNLNCEGGCLDVTYSDIGEVTAGTGNVSEDPLFVSGTLGNFYLSYTSAGQGENSPCVDSGSTLARNIGLDTRNTGTHGITDRAAVDMGYHYSPVPVYITAADPGGSTFKRGDTVTHTIVYGIEGSPDTLYQVNVKVIVKGAFKKTYSKKETHYPGVYTTQIKKIVPNTAALKNAKITYKVILREAGTTQIIGTDKQKTSITIQ
jgi:PKD repeat protein